MYAKFSDVTYAAIHKEKKKFFVGSGSKISFAKKHHLKSSMTYQKANHDDYKFVVINTDGTMVEVQA